jgi:hypothetical protein
MVQPDFGVLTLLQEQLPRFLHVPVLPVGRDATQQLNERFAGLRVGRVKPHDAGEPPQLERSSFLLPCDL